MAERLKQYQTERAEENAQNLNELLTTFRKWLYLEETEDIEVMLSCLLDREVPGDPVWLQVIGNSGDKKTEILRSFGNYEKAYSIDTITTKTLISGLTRRNKETGDPEPIAGLLFKINGKTLIIKDFSTTLGKSEEYRTEFYGQLRNIYDGYFEGGFGTMPDKVSIPSEIGLIAAATPMIDRYNRLENSLGTRFLKVRTDTDPVKATIKALQNSLQAGKMRTQLKNTVENFIKNLQSRGCFEESNLPTVSEEQKSTIISLALYLANMRATVWGKFDKTGDLISLESVDIEKPTRAAKQFMKLAQILAIIRSHVKVEDSEIRTLQRIARDTAEPTRQRIMDSFKAQGMFEATLTTQDIDGITKGMGKRIHYRTARNELECMSQIGIVDYLGNQEYRVSEPFRGTARSAYIYPLPTSEKKPESSLISEVTEGGSIGGDTFHPFATSEKEPEKTPVYEVTSLPSLSIALGQLTNKLATISGQISSDDYLRDELKWPEDFYQKIYGIAMRDGVIYSPRSGMVKLTT